MKLEWEKYICNSLLLGITNLIVVIIFLALEVLYLKINLEFYNSLQIFFLFWKGSLVF